MIPAGTGNGNGNGIIVWFACKICRHSFQNIDSFLEHKRKVHFGEFKKLSCVVFEERDIAEYWKFNLGDGSSLPPATVIKQESLLSSEDQHSDLKPEINIALARKAEVEPDPTVCQIKNETGTFPKNPYVLLQRLKSKKIQQYNKCQTQALLPYHLQLHLEAQTHGKRFRCPHPNCERSYSIRNSLRSHLVTHTEKELYKCQEPNCGREFKRKKSLCTHLLTHSDSRPFFHCPYHSCRKVFRQKFGLQAHCLTRHSQDSSPLIDKLLKNPVA